MKSEQVQPGIAELVATANRLRTARAACRQFLAFWAVQQAAKEVAPALASDDATADPENRDWSALYRGNILDD